MVIEKIDRETLFGVCIEDIAHRKLYVIGISDTNYTSVMQRAITKMIDLGVEPSELGVVSVNRLGKVGEINITTVFKEWVDICNRAAQPKRIDTFSMN